jgi:hypothetical protein
MFQMRESWWRYHLSRWASGDDKTLRDLSDRVLHRKLFKTVRIEGDRDKLIADAREAVAACGYDASYYLHEISTADMHAGDTRQSMLVQLDSGQVITLSDADPMFKAMVTDSRLSKRSWLAMPREVKSTLKRIR